MLMVERKMQVIVCLEKEDEQGGNVIGAVPLTEMNARVHVICNTYSGDCRESRKASGPHQNADDDVL